MSCNYYIHTKDTEMVFDLAPRVTIDEDNREFVIHVCQTAIGWRTLIECHNYFSLKELIEILRNPKYTYVIKDEYGKKVGEEWLIENIKARQENSANRSGIGSECDSPDRKIFADDDGYEFMDCAFN